MSPKDHRPLAVLPEDIQAPLFFLDQDACRDWLLKRLHPDPPACPGCGYVLATKRQIERFWALETVKCPKCSKSFYAFTGTIFRGIHMKLTGILLMMVLFKCGCQDHVIAWAVGVSPTAIANWRRKFSEARQA